MEVRAARLIEHGQPLVVEEVDLAQPSDGEVVVTLAYGGVNPVDRYGALGRVAPDGPLPRTLGSEASGRVDGRPVLVRGHRLGTARDGLWAEKAVVPAAAVTALPERVSLEAAAAMGVAGVTAWRTVTEKAQVGPDDRVLVLGAGGGVGSIAVSVARSLGATVWGQTGSAEKVDWIRQRGAVEVVVADAASLAELARPLRPTVVLDPLGDGFFGAAVELLEPRGRLVLYGTSADPTGEVPLQLLYRKGLTVYGYGGLIEPDDVLAEHLEVALQALADGLLEVVVDRLLPLAEVNRAFDLLVDREVRGKVLLDLGA
ncbi:MAG: quinone oxidoreductase family protein [Acidimicrobiales bacterium]